MRFAGLWRRRQEHHHVKGSYKALLLGLRRAVAGSEYTKPEPHRGGSKRAAARQLDPAGAAELYGSTGGESSEWDHFGVCV